MRHTTPTSAPAAPAPTAPKPAAATMTPPEHDPDFQSDFARAELRPFRASLLRGRPWARGLS